MSTPHVSGLALCIPMPLPGDLPDPPDLLDSTFGVFGNAGGLQRVSLTGQIEDARYWTMPTKPRGICIDAPSNKIYGLTDNSKTVYEHDLDSPGAMSILAGATTNHANSAITGANASGLWCVDDGVANDGNARLHKWNGASWDVMVDISTGYTLTFLMSQHVHVYLDVNYIFITSASVTGFLVLDATTYDEILAWSPSYFNEQMFNAFPGYDLEGNVTHIYFGAAHSSDQFTYVMDWDGTPTGWSPPRNYHAWESPDQGVAVRGRYIAKGATSAPTVLIAEAGGIKPAMTAARRLSETERAGGYLQHITHSGTGGNANNSSNQDWLIQGAWYRDITIQNSRDVVFEDDFTESTEALGTLLQNEYRTTSGHNWRLMAINGDPVEFGGDHAQGRAGKFGYAIYDTQQRYAQGLIECDFEANAENVKIAAKAYDYYDTHVVAYYPGTPEWRVHARQQAAQTWGRIATFAGPTINYGDVVKVKITNRLSYSKLEVAVNEGAFIQYAEWDIVPHTARRTLVGFGRTVDTDDFKILRFKFTPDLTDYLDTYYEEKPWLLTRGTYGIHRMAADGSRFDQKCGHTVDGNGTGAFGANWHMMHDGNTLYARVRSEISPKDTVGWYVNGYNYARLSAFGNGPVLGSDNDGQMYAVGTDLFDPAAPDWLWKFDEETMQWLPFVILDGSGDAPVVGTGRSVNADDNYIWIMHTTGLMLFAKDGTYLRSYTTSGTFCGCPFYSSDPAPGTEYFFIQRADYDIIRVAMSDLDTVLEVWAAGGYYSGLTQPDLTQDVLWLKTGLDSWWANTDPINDLVAGFNTKVYVEEQNCQDTYNSTYGLTVNKVSIWDRKNPDGYFHDRFQTYNACPLNRSTPYLGDFWDGAGAPGWDQTGPISHVDSESVGYQLHINKSQDGWNFFPGTADGTMSAHVHAPVSTNEALIAVRGTHFSGWDNCIYVKLKGDNVFELIKRDAGVDTLLDSDTGDWGTTGRVWVEIVLSGTSIIVYTSTDGGTRTERCNVTEAFNQSEIRHGIMTLDTNSQHGRFVEVCFFPDGKAVTIPPPMDLYNPPAAPATPVPGITATAEGLRIKLHYGITTDKSLDTFSIERSLTGTGGWAEIVEPAGTTNEHVDLFLDPSTPYYYRVKAKYTDVSESAYSTTATATTGTVAQQLAAYGIWDAYQIDDAVDGDDAGYSLDDLSGNGLHGTIVFTPTYKDDGTPDVNDMGGTRIEQDVVVAASDHFNIDSVPINDMESITVYVAFRADTWVDWHYLFSNRDGDGFYVGLAAIGSIFVGDGGAVMPTFDDQVNFGTPGEWYEAAIVIDETLKQGRIINLITGTVVSTAVDNWVGYVDKSGTGQTKLFGRDNSDNYGLDGAWERIALLKGAFTRDQILEGHVNPARVAAGLNEITI